MYSIMPNIANTSNQQYTRIKMLMLSIVLYYHHLYVRELGRKLLTLITMATVTNITLNRQGEIAILCITDRIFPDKSAVIDSLLDLLHIDQTILITYNIGYTTHNIRYTTHNIGYTTHNIRYTIIHHH